MTIQTFLKSTATTSVADLRQAVTVALAVERPTAGEGYARFYRRVVAELSLASDTNHDQTSAQPVSTGVMEQRTLDSDPAGWRSSRI